jgi:L-seryl-tRNA(Ser) seleniumtransferase
MKRLINATGILIHTNLGRAPLPKVALERLMELMIGYMPLEYNLEEGKRGERDRLIEGIFEKLTGAEASIIVNNNAAGILLTLNTLANGREVIISRGELIELGASFRLPEVIKASGAILKRVGSINKTTIDDYINAINERTALIMVCHRSNFIIQGNSSSPGLKEIIKVAHSHELPFVYDEGSGRLIEGITDGSPSIKEAIKMGADLVLSSGDKLLGGPQAGLILGEKEFIERLHKNHLLRALRVDKTRYVILSEVLEQYFKSNERELPIIKNIFLSKGVLKKRAERITSVLRTDFKNKVIYEVLSGVAEVGGGSLPGVQLESIVIRLQVNGINSRELAKRLRFTSTPVVARVEDEWLVMDMRSLLDGEEELLTEALREVIK